MSVSRSPPFFFFKIHFTFSKFTLRKTRIRWVLSFWLYWKCDKKVSRNLPDWASPNATIIKEGRQVSPMFSAPSPLCSLAAPTQPCLFHRAHVIWWGESESYPASAAAVLLSTTEKAWPRYGEILMLYGELWHLGMEQLFIATQERKTQESRVLAKSWNTDKFLYSTEAIQGN